MNKSGIADQVISHPQGGGAIKGLGESFSPDLHTGTGNLVVPIALPQGRNKLQPDLSLVHSSGQGNGVFGFGWATSIPGVSRDTRRGIPAYADDSDTFLLSGVEPLVATRASADGAMLYRPRTEGLFARIAHHVSLRDDYWEVRSRDGLTSLYGHPDVRVSDTAVVRDPDDVTRIFAWSLTETTDSFGNRIEYLYEHDAVIEDGPHRWDQRYLTTIRYVDYGPRDAPRFLVTVDFVYEPRPDPFSTYRAGFEIRTTRRCARIEIRTHADTTRLARVYRFVYDDAFEPTAGAANGVSLLRRIEVDGVDGDARESLPPLEFGYTGFDPARRVYQAISAVGDAVPERSLAHPDFELADLFGRGLPDVVQIGDEQRYWKNLGDGRFDVPRLLDGMPPGVRLGDQGTQLADLDGDGHIDLLVSGGALDGYFPLTIANGARARPFVPFAAAPPFKLNDPELRLVDLDGDGVTDALRTGADFELYFNDRAAGWVRAERRTRDDFDRFPDVFFSDPRVKLADMTGDGLQDIVFVNEGHVEYWPYLGNGRWGRRIAMSGRVEFPDALAFGGIGFDPKRVLLGDVDGDGAADLVYVESGRVTIWLNQSGNGWSDPIVVGGTPPISEVDAVRLVDVLGRGIAGVLWTYDAGTFADSTYKFLDLTGGTKPYLLNERTNNVGARTLVEYTSSTRFFVDDDVRPETRWRSRLPFPVQVVSRIELIDELSGGKLTSEYRYHQGYWDGDEREFRGFGMVEQLDTETFDRYNAEGLHGAQPFTTVDRVQFSPPTLTRTWFHQGQVQDADGEWSESGITLDAWSGDPGLFSPDQRVDLAAIARTAALDADPVRIRHALRALQGSVLRSELYALDDSPARDRPYTVIESLYDVREIEGDDPRAATRLRIFFGFRAATRTTQWERGADPMTRLMFLGDHDAYGLPRSEVTVAVPRGRDPLVAASGTVDSYLSTFTRTEYAQRDDADRYMVDRVSRSTGYEVVNDGRQAIFALRDAVVGGSATLRLVSHARTFYDGDAFVGLPLGQVGSFGAAVRSESLVFTDDFLKATFDPGDPLAVMPSPSYLRPGVAPTWTPEYPDDFRSALPPLGGYVHYADSDVPGSPGGYFVVSDRRRYDFHDGAAVVRGMRTVLRDSLGTDAAIEYDAYALLPIRVTDSIGLTDAAGYDYRVLQPARLADVNGNVSEYHFSPAGVVVAQFVRGKNGEGDAANPSTRIEYDVLAFAARGAPTSVRTIRRVHHDGESDVASDERDRTIEAVEYFDGFGRMLQKRALAEDTLFGDPAFGGGVLPVSQASPVPPATGRTRQATDPVNVLVSGRTRYDNKGRPVETFEPYFAKGWDYAAPSDAETGQAIVTEYDARGRLVRTLVPDGSEQRVVYGVPSDLANPSEYTPTAWETYAYDANDNGGRTHAQASASYASHWNTPSSTVVDALGRTTVAVARNGAGPADWYTTRSTYDIHGNVLAVVDPLGRTASRSVFDLAKRAWRVETIAGGRHDAMLDVHGQALETRDAKGALTLRAFDALGRPTALWARDDASGAVTLRQRLEYGDGGRPDQPTAERDAARSRNLLRELARHHDEAGLSTIASVDFKGNVLQKSRRMIADAPISAVFANAAANGWRVTPFRVDWQPAGRSLADVEAALLETTPYQTDAVYDALDRLVRLALPTDVEGRRRTIRSVYNAAGGLEKVFVDDTLYVDRIAYDAKGQRTLIAYGNGLVTRYAYDPLTFRLKRIRTERATQPDPGSYVPSGAPLQDYAYDFDLAGNIVGIDDRTPGSGVPNNPDAASAGDPVLAQLLSTGDALVRRFTYDPIYRLLAATGRECDRPPDAPPWLDVPRSIDLTKARAYDEHYVYDAVGNVTRIAHHAGADGFVRDLTIDPATNRLQSMQIGQTSVVYTSDAAGNITSETSSRHFEWNHGDGPRVFRTQTDGIEPTVYAQYLYDASGQRVKKLVRKQGGDIEVTEYVDGIFEHRRWASGAVSGENDTVHVMDNKQRIALVRIGPARPGDSAPAVRFQLGDHLRSVTCVVDASGALVNREDFTPYGETTFGTFAKKTYRFTGNERDEESGLEYHRARYYAPWLARWASVDPLATRYPGWSPYAYALANPINVKDDTGQAPDPPEPTDPTSYAQAVDDLQARITAKTNELDKIAREIDVASNKFDMPEDAVAAMRKGDFQQLTNEMAQLEAEAENLTAKGIEIAHNFVGPNEGSPFRESPEEALLASSRGSLARSVEKLRGGIASTTQWLSRALSVDRGPGGPEGEGEGPRNPERGSARVGLMVTVVLVGLDLYRIWKSDDKVQATIDTGKAYAVNGGAMYAAAKVGAPTPVGLTVGMLVTMPSDVSEGELRGQARRFRNSAICEYMMLKYPGSASHYYYDWGLFTTGSHCEPEDERLFKMFQESNLPIEFFYAPFVNK